MGLQHNVIFVLIIFSILPTSYAFADNPDISWKVTIKTSPGINSTSFWPPEIHARENETIQWINNDTTAHTVTSGVLDHPTFVGKIFDSGVINPGESYSFKIPSNVWSSYYYFCKIHPWMIGKIDAGVAYLEVSPDFTISTDKKSYSDGDTIRISGIVNNTLQTMPLTIQIFDSQRNLIYQNKTNLFEDHSFLHELKATNSIFKTSGSYKIKSFYGFPATITDVNIIFNGSQSTLSNTTQNRYYIPHWIKNDAKWWADNKINDNDFTNVLQFMIKTGHMSIPVPDASKINSNIIPIWIKNNAGEWTSGTVSDEEFISSITYLINHGIVNP
jgi:plastocyanin